MFIFGLSDKSKKVANGLNMDFGGGVILKGVSPHWWRFKGGAAPHCPQNLGFSDPAHAIWWGSWDISLAGKPDILGVYTCSW